MGSYKSLEARGMFLLSQGNLLDLGMRVLEHEIHGHKLRACRGGISSREDLFYHRGHTLKGA